MGNSCGKGKARPGKGSEVWGRTKIDVHPVRYIWVIDQFPLWLNEIAKTYEYSPTFSTGKHKWRLQLDPKFTHEDQAFMSLFLTPVESQKEKVFAEYKLGILDDEGKCVSVFETNRHFDFEKKPGYGWGRFIRKDILLNKENRYLPNDTLTLFCEISVIDPSPISGSGSYTVGSQPKIIVPESHLLTSNFQNFLQSKFLSDVILAIGSREFPSHKFILAATSPVFRAMFQHNMKEEIENRVEIKDIGVAVFEEFLHFIYTGEVKNLKKNSEALLVVAERYGVEKLKAICEKSLARQLSVENLARIHELANLHNAKQLKMMTTKFLEEHLVKISKSPGFLSLKKDNPELYTKVLELLLAKNNS